MMEDVRDGHFSPNMIYENGEPVEFAVAAPDLLLRAERFSLEYTLLSAGF